MLYIIYVETSTKFRNFFQIDNRHKHPSLYEKLNWIFPNFYTNKNLRSTLTFYLLSANIWIRQFVILFFLIFARLNKMLTGLTCTLAHTHTRRHSRFTYNSLTDCKIQKRIFFDFRVKFVILFCCYRYELIFLILILSFYYPCWNKKIALIFLQKNITWTTTIAKICSFYCYCMWKNIFRQLFSTTVVGACPVLSCDNKCQHQSKWWQPADLIKLVFFISSYSIAVPNRSSQ